MAGDFSAELQTIAERSPADMKEQVRQGAEALAAARVESFEALCSVLLDTAAAVDLRLAACWFLGRLGDKRATLSLLAVLGENALTWESAKALGSVGDKSAVQPLIEFLNDEAAAAETRAAAAYTLSLLGDERATVPLVSALPNQDLDPLVRGHVAEALAHLGGDRIVGHLIAALNDASPEVRFWVSFALGEKGNQSALPELERLVRSDHAVLSGWGKLSDAAHSAIRRIAVKNSRAR